MERDLRIIHVMVVDGGVLPEGVLLEILLTLPVTHLLRLRCVCKSWCALIGDFNFIKRHYGVQYSVCKQDGYSPSICDGPVTDVSDSDFHLCCFSRQNEDDPLNLIPDLLRDTAPSFANNPDFFNRAHFVGVVNGIVCIRWGKNDVGLWNPATREFKATPSWLYDPNNFHGLIGFGFDCASNDFKIVRGFSFEDVTPSPEVYSLTSNTWKGITVPSNFDIGGRCYSMEAYLNGVCYWTVLSYPSETPHILSFNFATEVLELFNQPQNGIGADISDGYNWTITLYKERLAFVGIHTDGSDLELVRSLDIWVVTKYHDNSGNPVVWQRVLTIGPFPSSNIAFFNAFRMDGNVVLTVEGPSRRLESSLYNPSTGTFNNYGFVLGLCRGYVGSLFPLSKKLI